MAREDDVAPSDFIRELVRRDLETGRCERVVTRFPPEPNGLPHIGHAKSICLNFGIAEEFGGRCHLRFDDTNPLTEESRYAEAMMRDIRWLGFDWGEHLHHASDYFEQLYEYAQLLTRKGKAFVCDLSSDEIFERQGSLTRPGRPSPYRDRSVEENLDLLERMRAGEFEPGTRVLRARIDMASPVLTMRDPLLYRIVGKPHYRAGDRWRIYPLYDFAHCLCDAIEGISHSICGLEFTDHRPLYEWILEAAELPRPRPQQIEFAELKLSYTALSKRFLRTLVDGKRVAGWDDPRMPTLSGLRRRGYPPQAIRSFCEGIGTTRSDSTIQLARLEHSVRENLNENSPRVMAVLDPLRVVIENYPEGRTEELEAINNPQRPAAGTRTVPFSRVLYIERDDFLEEPPKKFHRLSPGREVRLRYAYFITCTDVVKDESGRVIELRCSYDPLTRGGDAPDGRKVKGTLHWVSAEHALEAEVRLYGPLFSAEDPMVVPEGGDFTDNLNPDSLQVLEARPVEPCLAGAAPGSSYQFERLGYFCVDPDSDEKRIVFNRTVTLRDSWARIARNS